MGVHREWKARAGLGWKWRRGLEESRRKGEARGAVIVALGQTLFCRTGLHEVGESL